MHTHPTTTTPTAPGYSARDIILARARGASWRLLARASGVPITTLAARWQRAVQQALGLHHRTRRLARLLRGLHARAWQRYLRRLQAQA